jgi:mRNA export factor
MFDMNSGQPQQVAAHNAAIKCVECVETNGQTILITAGWDKKLKVGEGGERC